jgi:beta-galactosidase
MLNMKIIVFLTSVLFLVPATFSQKKPIEFQKSHRIEKVINSNWTFNYFTGATLSKGMETPGFDDTKWPAISIPHTWNTYETTGEVHPFIRNTSESENPYWWLGWGWYRKHFSVNPEYSGRKVFIEFEGVQKYCKVWLNGKYLGDHKGGYGSFDFDISDLVKTGDNVLAVTVNNRQKDDFKIPPMATGKFNVYGGIRRDVKLVIKDKLYIPMQGSASHEGGTFVTTPQLSEKEGIVRVQTWVKNDNPEKKSCVLITSVTDASDKVVQVMKSESSIEPGQLFMFDQTAKPIKNPHLWSHDDPYLYKIISQVTDGKMVADICTSPLGFRWFRWDYKENLLYVNGKKMVIHGGNRQEDYPWLGDAIPKWITLMDLTDISENLNYNFLRTSHYPNDNFVYDLTDKYGIVTEEESPSIDNQEFSPEVQQQQMKEMIRRDRNHPSIVLWSMGCETNNAINSKIAAAEDTTRIITAQRVTGGPAGNLIKLTDRNLNVEILPRCTIRGWYNKDVKDMEPVDSLRSGTEEYQQLMLTASRKFGRENLCTWIYADFGDAREYLNTPLLHINTEGYVDMYRQPKYAYYFWKASYGKTPMIFVQPHFWRSVYLGKNEDIVVNSNCEKVELFVNGISKGTQSPDRDNFYSLTFKNILIERGSLSAVATMAGKTVRTELVMADEPAKIVLSASHQKIKADRSSVAIVTADIVDSKGTHIYGANNTIKWNVTGPALLAGPSVYESDVNRQMEKDGVWYIDMPVSNVIRSSGKPGKIHVSASGSGLASGSCDIDAEEIESDNSVFSEPVLIDEGRIPVTKIVLQTNTLEQVPAEVSHIAEEINLGQSAKPEYSFAIRNFIKKNNPLTDTSTIEFNALTTVYVSQLSNSKGHLTAEDYNYNADHFNNCRLICGYVNKTKLPAAFKEGLRKYYSDEIIRNGSEKNAGEEMNWLNWIPSGGTVVVFQTDKVNDIKGVLYSKSSDLQEIITLVYPKFADFSVEARERALVFIKKVNPFVHLTSSTGADIKKTTGAYTAEKGEPILIPLLKFISE